MTEKKSPYVVAADWVESQQGKPGFSLVDASWYLPAQNRNGKEEFAAGHIPGAVFFDQDVIADHSTGLPHSIPSADMFAAEVGKLGISNDDTIVVYDGPGIFTAPRVWWLFRLFGAANVYVLDGGISGWKHEGRATETGEAASKPATFVADPDFAHATSFEAMSEIVETGSVQIADARGAGRFTGAEAEPREGMRSGHMPGAFNLPFSVFSDNGYLKPLGELKTIIDNTGIDLSKPVVTSCGSGVTAAVLILALQSLGHHDNTLYDGSWSEWGSRPDTQIITGD